jgi:hypothetical protein
MRALALGLVLATTTLGSLVARDALTASTPPSAGEAAQAGSVGTHAAGLFVHGGARETRDASDTSGVDPRATLPAPVITLTDAGKARFAPLPARPGTVPVLLFHQVCPDVCAPEDTYGVTQAELMRMLLVVQNAGYSTLSIVDYVRAMRGDTAGLPSHPILVTFDDGRLDAYRGADEVVRALGMRVTMYVMTIELERRSGFRMSSEEVDAAFASGRWDIQLHAHAGHVRIRGGGDDAGVPTIMPFYAARRSDKEGDSEHLEPLADWKARAFGDVTTGHALLAARYGRAYASLTFAVPFSDYGQGDTNDPAIAPAFRAFLDERFAVWFTQPDDPDFTRPPSSPSATREASRFIIERTTTAENVYDWLALCSAGPPPAHE